MALNDPDEASCPRCGEVLEDDFREVTPDVDENTLSRVSFDCPGCGTALAGLLLKTIGMIGVDVWVEDRREGDHDDPSRDR